MKFFDRRGEHNVIDFTTEFNWLKAKEKNGYYEIKTPLLIRMAHCSLVLRIIPLEDSYVVSDDGLLFAECGNHDTAFYYNHYVKNCGYPNYGIQLEGNFFYKKYDNSYTPLAAISDFIHFFIYLEEHIEKSGIL